ncbi:MULTISPECIES: TetR/AcrR family transcriptional regulator [unclassified Crossiella]|uniref:TetR/AcrR family transcriptional regulator n=1 Tax=unclassified Crossiella TaxID=2620835 RepID=UPI001FFF0989|nr:MULTISPECIES: TetR/AcrR family transcriptional regulator [unclassified Crossiella]MCK2238995.1 TetR/AcrR family transcriptional regulator [Crossiella sp. S99.2]MCK2251436.1 TetR/AcrR family transcriptional regulator [Crossiella sp. S99.1]
MTEAEGQGSRERYRAQVREEIKQHAWRQIATAGVNALSLNAIAKQVGMSGPALYRYFASRDDLITALIRDAYQSLADTVRATDTGAANAATGTGVPIIGKGPAAGPATKIGANAANADAAKANAAATTKTGTAADADTSAGANLARLAHAIRDWARADPQRYFLIYGTPVPGYHAPEDTTAISAQVMAVLLDACAVLPPATTPATPFDTHLVTHREWADHPAPAATLHRALSFWTRLHGVLSLELAGHFTGMKFDPDLLITDELNALLDQ